MLTDEEVRQERVRAEVETRERSRIAIATLLYRSRITELGLAGRVEPGAQVPARTP